VIPEPARQVLAEHRSSSGAGEIPHDRFVALLLDRSVDAYEQTRLSGEAAVFDRGIPDCIAYALHLGVDAGPSIAAAQRYRYRNEVLVLSPWQEIYTTDEERQMSFDLTRDFHRRLETAYDLSGYELVEVPLVGIDERRRFVTEWLGAG
jgi:predicted ATPase